MTVRKKQVGTGMTSREETHVEGTGASARFPGKRAMTDPEDWQALGDNLKAAGRDPRAELRAFCEGIAGDRRGRWLAVAERRAALTKGSEAWELAGVELAELRPPDVDTPEWFAETILEHLGHADYHRGKGRHEDAARWDFQAGLTFGVAGMKFEWESITMTGAKVILGGEKGAEVAHGTKQKRKLRDDKLQEAMDAARKRNPTAPKAEVRRIVSEETGVSNSTLRRHTIDPIDRGK